MSTDILSIRDISLSFAPDAGNDAPLRILDRLSLGVPRGKITALVGGNGSGKTTLFNIISGFQKPDSGEVWFHAGAPNSATPPVRIDGCSPAIIPRLGIGRLFQNRQLFPTLTLLENFTIAADDFTGEFPFSRLAAPVSLRRAETAKESRARDILVELFGPDNKYLAMLHEPGGAFSHGELRLLSLARLLMPGGARLLLLDEPTSGVNPVLCDTIAEILPRLVRDHGLSVLLIEHNMPFVRRVADCCAYLSKGKIAALGTPGDILGSSEVRASYLGLEPASAAPPPHQHPSHPPYPPQNAQT